MSLSLCNPSLHEIFTYQRAAQTPSQNELIPLPIFTETTVWLTPIYSENPCKVKVRWSLQGATDKPLIIAQGGISATRSVCTHLNQKGWWSQLIGYNSPIDLHQFSILSIDWLEIKDFDTARAVDTKDQANAIAAILDKLNIEAAHAYIGASYGAMVGLALAELYPNRLKQLIAISGAHAPHPQATALRAIQRHIVRLGIESGKVEESLSLARQLAMVTYRSPEELKQRFTGEASYEESHFSFPIEKWLEAAGARFITQFTPERFLALSESIDLHNVTPEKITVPTTLIGADSDQLVPLADLYALQQRLGGLAKLHTIPSLYGHDAFLKEYEQLSTLLSLSINNHGALQ